MSDSSDSAAEAPLLEALDDRDGPALRLSATERAARVDAALSRALPQRRTFFERPRLSLLLLAAALGMTGIAAALVVVRPHWLGLSSQVPPSAGAPARSPGAPGTSTPRDGSGASEATPTSAPPLPAAGAGLPAKEAVLAGPEAVSSPGAERASSARGGSAADLLKAANQLRRQGQWAEAERAYAQVATSFTGSAQGPVAALAAASLRLEHLSDPRGALRLYRSALKAPSLSAEAELGVADCYRALGDRAAEIAALRRVTSAHPEAVFYERALRRLQALEGDKL